MKSKVEQYTEWMENLANDNSHGYSQTNRWGPDYDCSSAVITALEQAGIPVKSQYGATFTGNMEQALLKAGFKDVTPGVNLETGAGLKRGDILLNKANHVAVYLGNGKLVHARSSEGNTQPGDQSGNEIRIQPYFNYPSGGWDCVLRLPETLDYDDTSDADPVNEKTGLVVDGECGPETWAALCKKMPIVKKGSRNWAATALQAMLNYLGADLDADGDCGPLTVKEIKEFQEGRL